MRVKESRRGVGQIMLLGFLAILCICQSGCFYWTQKVWRDGYAEETVRFKPAVAPTVRMSAEGDLCVTYGVRVSRRRGERGEFLRPDWGYSTAVGASRVLILMRDDLRRLSTITKHQDVPIISAKDLHDRVLPSRVTKLAFDQDRVDRLTAEWREIPVVLFEFLPRDPTLHGRLSNAERKRLLQEARAEARTAGKAFVPGNLSFIHHKRTGLEVPDGKGGRVLLVLPERHDRSLWPWARRVLLTPPALALDVVESPLHIPIIGKGIMWAYYIGDFMINGFDMGKF